MPGRIAGVVVLRVLDGSTVLATVLAAVADAGGCDTSGNCSTFDSVSASFDGVNVIGVSSNTASGVSPGPSDTGCSSTVDDVSSAGIISSVKGTGVASSCFATGAGPATFLVAAGAFANKPAQPPTLLFTEVWASVFSLTVATGVSVLVSSVHAAAAGVSTAPFVGVSLEVAARGSPQLSSPAVVAVFVPFVCVAALAPRAARSVPRPRPRLSPAPRPRPPRLPAAAVDASLALGFFLTTSPHCEIVPRACQYSI